MLAAQRGAQEKRVAAFLLQPVDFIGGVDGTALLRLQVVALHRVFQPAVLHTLIVDGVAATEAANQHESPCLASISRQSCANADGD
jgi:hypothetical protein